MVAIDNKNRHSALAFAYTLLGYLQAEHEFFKDFRKEELFENSFGYKLITKIIEYIKGE